MKNLKRFLALFFALALVLVCACDAPDPSETVPKDTGAQEETGNVEDPSDSEPRPTQETMEEWTEDPFEEPTEDPGEDPGDDDAVVGLQLLKKTVTYNGYRKVDGVSKRVCKVTSSAYTLSEQDGVTFPRLLDTLNMNAAMILADSHTAFDVLREKEQEELFDSFLSRVTRADSRMVSIYEEHSCWFGDGWGLEIVGINLDPRNGGTVGIDEIVLDLDAFEKKLAGKLADTYGETFTSNNFLKDGGYLKTKAGSYAFTVGYEGVTVYFNDNLASNDWMSATVYFDENPELFAPYYAKALENYIVPFNEDSFAEVDVNGDGKREVITAGAVPGDYYFDFTIYGGGSPIGISDNAYTAQFYLVKNRGQYYMYLFQLSEDNYGILAVADLKSWTLNTADQRNFAITQVYTDYDSHFVTDGSALEEIVYEYASSDAMLLESEADLLGNYTKTGIYAVGKNGYPVLVSDDYGTSSLAVIEAKKDFNCDIVNENGDVIGQALIKKGDLLYLARSDYATYADLQNGNLYPFTESDLGYDGIILRRFEKAPGLTEGETIYRVKIERDVWLFKINGEPEENLFYGIMYGG